MATGRRMLRSAVGSRGFARLSMVPGPGLGKGTERGFALQPRPGKPELPETGRQGENGV